MGHGIGMLQDLNEIDVEQCFSMFFFFGLLKIIANSKGLLFTMVTSINSYHFRNYKQEGLQICIH